ncbi:MULTISPECIES: DUF2834 domain-containing protein [unclassified Synechococcus]|jgi:xanthine/uracil/vitamin C permease (AzgA family)|nr:MULTISPECIES: DUF2834 domain-containing protein [unclassified Synechococcus]MEA5424061.1 DUF2834 domain-containing protein [Synechococcus sp. CCY9202]CAK6689948.1 hypothetical protein IFHNHDMJ_00715 [Synechococcus sp. CBW1107]
MTSKSFAMHWLPQSPLQAIYLILAIAGAVLPWMANLDFIELNHQAFDLPSFIALATANPAATSLSRDLMIGATAVVIWIVQESRRLQMRGLIWVLLSCVLIAFACGAPLFLYLRERRLAEQLSEGVQATGS